ncbi:LuxR C-terminal-related transcriptional regulator [Streptomyces sp. NPDC059740]|uniref:LuxR C-terminal-related transcriptional regulator n=1 Tax=Streptomyces sp. NPDC059740 TaxID=3346926 RepID=UPI00365ED5B2
MELIAASLHREEDLDVITEATDYEELIASVASKGPSVAIMDPDRVDGDCLAAVAEIRRVRPACEVVLSLEAPAPGFAGRAIQAGVLGIIPKSAGLRRLIESIRAVASGQAVVDPRLFTRVLARESPLTGREAEILRLTESGGSVKEMAKELHLSAGTVRNLASAAIRKLDARNRYDAMRIAREKGWL